MKAVRISLIVLAAALLAAGISTTSNAFHSGGVAECEGCHSMHSPAVGGSYLLVGATQSAACLTCHESGSDTGPNGYHVSTVGGSTVNPLQRTPGGDFAWTKRIFTYTYGSGTTGQDNTSGHNIVASAMGYNVDPVNATAPGGTFPSAQLQCNSCHDPHGKYRRKQDGTIVTTGQPIKASGSYDCTATSEPTATEAVGVYRLLAGSGYSKGGVTFQGVPAAKVPGTYNRTEATTQTRTAYGNATTGGHVAWGTWCATCHGDMHSSGNYVHPTDQTMSSTIMGNYNSYVKSGDLGGTVTNSFLSLVPFVEGTNDYSVLASHAKNNDTQLGGPTATTSDKVSCISCHRAHGSGFSHLLRFDYGYEFMTKGGLYIGSDNPEVTGTRAGLQHRGRTQADWEDAYYDRPPSKFATYQRVLCNKCHAKD